MSDFDLPELPSDEELGITDEDREFLKELGDERPEMSDAEMKALLGDAPPAPAAKSADPKAAAQAEKQGRKEAKQAEREARRVEKEAAKRAKQARTEARKAEKEAKKAEKEAKKAARPDGGSTPTPSAAESDAERAQRLARAIGAQARGETGPAAPPPPPPPEAGPAPKRKKARPPEGPRSRWRGPVTLVLLLAVAVVASSRTGLPRPVPANAPDTAFSSARAMSTLIEIARAPHPPGSPEHARVREYLVERLRALGHEPEIQTETSVITAEGIFRAATVRNIVARIPGSDPTGAVLITAHYDGRDIAVAAGDDGVGVVTIVETLRALGAEGRLRNDVIVLLTDGEELGLLGARAFVDHHPWMADVSIVLSVEMRGGGGPSIMFETNEQNGWVVRALDRFAPRPFANSMAIEVYARMPNDTDFTPFKEAGKQGLNFAAADNAHVYHQSFDTPQAVSESTVQHHGIHLLAATRHFGAADLSTVDGPDVVYFNLPLVGLVVYPDWWVIPISGLVALLFVTGFLASRRRGARLPATGLGVLLALVGYGAAYGAVRALAAWLPRFHPEAGSLHGSTYHAEGWYVVAVAAIAFVVVTGVHALGRRWLSRAELALGALVMPAVGAVAMGFAAPMAAMNLQWPAAAGATAVALWAALGARSEGTPGWLVAVVAAVPVLAMLTPLTELIWIALTFDLAPYLAVMAVLALHLCLPAVEALRHPNGWWAPALGAVVASASVGFGILLSRPAPERPMPSTLVYAYEHGTGAAVWATDARADSLDAVATAWAVERAGSSFDGTRDLTPFAHPQSSAPTAPAPVVAARPPEIVLTRDSVEGQSRHVTMTVRSRIGAEYLAFLYDERGDTRLVSVDGEPVPDPAALRRAEHFGEPDSAVVLELELPADQPIGLHVVEHLLRPAELLGPEAFARPPELAPDITALSDRAMFRYSVGAFADPRHMMPLPGAPPPTGDAEGDAGSADSAGAAPDTSAAEPDTGTVAPDTSATPDTSVLPDTTGVPGSVRGPGS